MIASLVYVLCTVASSVVAFLLFRSYQRTRVRFLLWSTLCFVGLALGNAVLFLDMVVYAGGPDLSLLRIAPALVGYSILIFGFIWDVV